MTSAERHRVSDRAIDDVLTDWRYKAGIEEGRKRADLEIRHRENERDLALTEFYKAAPVECAALCDKTLDRSGALLGRVREWAAPTAQDVAPKQRPPQS